MNIDALICLAMPVELRAFLEGLTQVVPYQQKIDSRSCFLGSYQGAVILLLETGVGKVNAAWRLTEALGSVKPRAILNGGFSGGLSPQLDLGHLVLGEKHIYYDVDVSHFGYTRGQLPAEPPFFSSHSPLLELFSQQQQQQGLSWPSGLFLTGDRFIASSEEKDNLLQNFPQAIALDMESAALAHVAHHYQIPFLSLRTISDHSDDQAEEKWKLGLSSDLLIENVENLYNLIHAYAKEN